MKRPGINIEACNPMRSTFYMTRYLNAKPYVDGKRILNAACGEGYGSALLKQWGAQSVVGMDASEESIQAAKKNYTGDNLEFIRHDLKTLPFDDVCFDMAVSIETVDHLDDPEMFLRELRRVVKSGGTIIVSCSNDQYYADNAEDYLNSHHVKRYAFCDFRQMAEKILGETPFWYMGSALGGFVNTPLDEYINTEKGSPVVSEGMPGMTQTGQMVNTYKVPSTHEVNSSECLYYVGVWGGDAAPKGQSAAAVYSAPFFSLYQNNQIPDSVALTKAWRNEYEALAGEKMQIERMLQESQKREAALNEEHRILSNELDRLRLLNDMQKKTERLHWDMIGDIQQRHIVEIGDIQQRHIVEIEAEKEALLQQQNYIADLKGDIAAQKESNRQLEELIQQMQNTKGWRILDKLRRILRRIH